MVLRAQATLHRETVKLQKALRAAYPTTTWRLSRANFVEIIASALDPSDLGRDVTEQSVRDAAMLIFDEKLASASPRPSPRSDRRSPKRGSADRSDPSASSSVSVREAISFFRLGYSSAAGVSPFPGNTNTLCGSAAVLPTLTNLVGNTDQIKAVRSAAKVYEGSGIPYADLANKRVGRNIASRMGIRVPELAP